MSPRVVKGKKPKLCLSPKSTKFQLSELPTLFPIEVSRSNAFIPEGKIEREIKHPCNAFKLVLHHRVEDLQNQKIGWEDTPTFNNRRSS